MFDPKLTGDFSDGLVDAEMTSSEFDEEVYVMTTDENLEDVMNKPEPEEKEETVTEEDSKEPEVDDDDLF